MESVQELSGVPEPSASTSRNGSAKSTVTQEEVEENAKEKGKRAPKGKKSQPKHKKNHRTGFFSSHEEKEMEETSSRGVIEEQKVKVDPEDPTSKATTSDSDTHPSSSDNQIWKGFVKIWKEAESTIKFNTFPPLKRIPKLTRRKSKRYRDTIVQLPQSSLEAEIISFKPSWKSFSLADLKAATNNFSHDNLIGEGGYAEVYKGQLCDGQFVAIKRLTRGCPEEMTTDYLSELGIIVHIDHPNIARLIGYGVEGGMHLVLQLSPHGSLASLLYGAREKLDWELRYRISVGTAEGLTYLHEGCQRRIIHKDIKASNILLSEDFEPQISDFGLAKWLPDQWSHHTVEKIEGTFGYLPPEFFMHGIVDEKTDVYAFGVLLLELITGRQALDSSQQSLVIWAKPFLKEDKIEELADPSLGGVYDLKQMNRVVSSASLCIHQSAEKRPRMSEVLQILKGDQLTLDLAKDRQKSNKLQRTYSEELFDADDYNSTKYLNDIDRHLQIVMGTCNDG